MVLSSKFNFIDQINILMVKMRHIFVHWSHHVTMCLPDPIEFVLCVIRVCKVTQVNRRIFNAHSRLKCKIRILFYKTYSRLLKNTFACLEISFQNRTTKNKTNKKNTNLEKPDENVPVIASVDRLMKSNEGL